MLRTTNLNSSPVLRLATLQLKYIKIIGDALFIFTTVAKYIFLRSIDARDNYLIVCPIPNPNIGEYETYRHLKYCT